jgi:hypothetical protein
MSRHGRPALEEDGRGGDRIPRRFSEEAIALGWTATDLFGVHPTVGVVWVDYCSGLMINARRVEAIGNTWIRYGNQTFRRDRPRRPVGVPVWEAKR